MPDTAHGMRTEDRRPQRERAVITPRAGGSLMTLLERDRYLGHDPGAVNVTHGYPEGMSPGWIREYQVHLPDGWPDAQPGELVAAICRYFRRLLRAEVYLTPTCSMGFAIAARR
jgi:hypothetical protein